MKLIRLKLVNKAARDSLTVTPVSLTFQIMTRIASRLFLRALFLVKEIEVPLKKQTCEAAFPSPSVSAGSSFCLICAFFVCPLSPRCKFSLYLLCVFCVPSLCGHYHLRCCQSSLCLLCVFVVPCLCLLGVTIVTSPAAKTKSTNTSSLPRCQATKWQCPPLGLRDDRKSTYLNIIKYCHRMR